MTKINHEEYEVLKELDDKWKWIARDEDGDLYAYDVKPGRLRYMWFYECGDAIRLAKHEHLFHFIQWEDSEPYNIKELIEEYEDYAYTAEHFSNAMRKLAKALGDSWNESEETEVKKDIEWLKEKIKEEHEYNRAKHNKEGFEGYAHREFVFKYVLKLINQLDEPEVLSQEWVAEHEMPVSWMAKEQKVVRVEHLQNLLVPKQEEITHKKVEKYLLDRNIRVIDIDVYEKMQSDLAEIENKIIIEKPVIPQFVANYIKWFKNDFEHNFAADIDFIISLIQVSHKFSRREKIKNWISKSGNAQKLLDTYRWGYEVEEEQKYIVVLGKSIYNTTTYGQIGEVNSKKIMQSMYANVENIITPNQYTKSEILEVKDGGDIFKRFAVKVEELEE